MEPKTEASSNELAALISAIIKNQKTLKYLLLLLIVLIVAVVALVSVIAVYGRAVLQSGDLRIEFGGLPEVDTLQPVPVQAQATQGPQSTLRVGGFSSIREITYKYSGTKGASRSYVLACQKDEFPLNPGWASSSYVHIFDVRRASDAADNPRWIFQWAVLADKETNINFYVYCIK
jgi:hypothetical protein